MDWFRSHHGAPSDSKWLVIARKAKVQPVAVVAVFWSLLDYASQQEARGDISGFDPESVAAFLGIEDDEVLAIMAALEDKGITENGRIANWDKRQPKREREDNSAERVQRHRDAKRAMQHDVTPCNASVTQETPRLDKIREELLRHASEPEAPKETTKKPFAFDDPLPVDAAGLLQGLPPWYEGHLRNALAGRSPGSLASYASQIVREWRAGKNTPQAPLPDVPVYVAPTKAPLLPPGARMLSLSELRDKRAKQNEEFLNATQ